MRAITAIAWKDLRLLMRDRGAAFFVFLFPLAVAVFFGAVFGGAGPGEGGGTIPVSVVNLSKGPRGAAFAKDLAEDKALKVTPAATAEEGRTLVRHGDVVACIEIPESFDTSMTGIMAGGGLQLTLVTDPSRRAEAGLLEGKLNELAFRQLASIVQDPAQMRALSSNARLLLKVAPIGADQRTALDGLFDSLDRLSEVQSTAAKAADKGADKGTDKGAGASDAKPGAGNGSGAGGWRPVRVTVESVTRARNGPNNAYEISFGQGVVWGLMGCVTAFGTSMAEERSRGTLLRLRTAPIRRRQLLLGKALACFGTCMLVQAILIAFGALVFGVRVREPMVAVVASLAAAAGFTGVMMAMAGLSRTEGTAQGLGRALILVLAMIGGGTIPLFMMPPIMQSFSVVSPFTWAVRCIDGYTWRALSVPELALPLAVLCVIGLVGFVVGTLTMRWQD